MARALLSARDVLPSESAWLAPSVHSKKPSVEGSFKDGPQGSTPSALPLCNPSSQGWARLRDLLLIHGIQQKQWVLLFTSGYKRTVTSVLLSAFSLPPWLALREASFRVESCLWRGLCGRELRTPSANSQRGTETLGPVAHKKLNPANNHMSELGRGSYPSQALR